VVGSRLRRYFWDHHAGVGHPAGNNPETGEIAGRLDD
jgi:hypothetical protein